MTRTASQAAKQAADASFRDYEAPSRDGVRDFYRLNHARQSLDFVREKKREFLSLDRARMTIWQALQELDALVDDSDPDTEVSQLEHALQSAEAARADGRPRWWIATALVHDLGKVLCLFGEEQWAVVGDTFPVGCAFSEHIVFSEFFEANLDLKVAAYQRECGIYTQGCGLDQVDFSWGHDEYLYQVLRGRLPEEGLYAIRYHSFYAGHSAGAYRHLMNERDEALLTSVRTLNRYDLYSKADAPPNWQALRPFYEALVEEFFPGELRW